MEELQWFNRINLAGLNKKYPILAIESLNFNINKNNMKTEKSIGIWMDHSTAHLMEFTSEPIETKIIESTFTHEVKEESLKKSESLMHNKEQHLQSEYYKKLREIVKNYKRVLLFGPTDAKIELYNILKADHHFENTKIETKQADKMTDNQQHAFVREYFSKH